MLSRLAAVLAATASGAALAEVKLEHIKYTSGATTMEGTLAYDDAVTGKRPGVLVCHEWWGKNDYAEGRARQLAELGYVAFALDLYGNAQTTTDPEQAKKWSAITKDSKEMRARADAALKVLAANERVDSSKLAAIGYCMGGTVALELARSGLDHTQNLRAIVAFHASTIAAKNPDDNRNIKGTVLICHGQDDTFVQPEQIADFHKQMTDAGIDYAFTSYAHAVHAFTNPAVDAFGIPGLKYNQKADRRSWAQMKDLFQEVLSTSAGQSSGPVSDTPALSVPTSLDAVRHAGQVRITWRGPTTNYDFQQSWLPTNSNVWHDADVENLRPATADGGAFVRSANALPQPMRFRVRSVEGARTSAWTDWKRAND